MNVVPFKSDWLISDPNPDVNCDCSLFVDPILRNGCENFYSLKWDNPKVTYEEVDCPPELAELHCGYPYATELNMPDTCAFNDFAPSPPSPTPPSTTEATASTTTKSTLRTTTTTATTSSITTTPTTTKTTATDPPATTDASTTAATTSNPSSDACCSWDYASCGDSQWCNDSKTNCEGPCGGDWVVPPSSCIPLNTVCTNDVDSCCNPLGNVACVGNQWYAQCQKLFV